MSKILRIDICGECKNSSWTGPRSGCCWKLLVKLTEYCAIHPDCPLEDTEEPCEKAISQDDINRSCNIIRMRYPDGDIS